MYRPQFQASMIWPAASEIKTEAFWRSNWIWDGRIPSQQSSFIPSWYQSGGCMRFTYVGPALASEVIDFITPHVSLKDPLYLQ